MPFLLLHYTFVFHRRFIFGASRSFNFFRDALFLRLRQDSMFLPSRLLLLLHDIYVFTAMPSFVAPRYFRFRRDAIFCYTTKFIISPRCPFLSRHDTFILARTSFASKR
jgi:hypothetical protein